MKKSLLGILFAVMLVVAAAPAFALVEIVGDTVQIDDVELNQGSATRLSLDRDGVLDIEVQVESDEDIDDLQVLAMIRGYEHGLLASASDTFRIRNGTIKTFHLDLELPDDVEVDDYVITVEVGGRSGSSDRVELPIEIDTERHKVKLEDVVLRPGNSVRAGSALFAVVRVENQGQDEEEDVRVTVSIPELGVSDTAFIDSIDEDEQEETEELYLLIPRDAEEGRYSVDVTVEYRDGREQLSTRQTIEVFQEALPEVRSEVLEQPPQPIIVQVAPPEQDDVWGGASTVRTALTAVLFVLIVVLLIVGLIVVLTMLRRREDEE